MMHNFLIALIVILVLGIFLMFWYYLSTRSDNLARLMDVRRWRLFQGLMGDRKKREYFNPSRNVQEHYNPTFPLPSDVIYYAAERTDVELPQRQQDSFYLDEVKKYY
jgi:hypothetical protein